MLAGGLALNSHVSLNFLSQEGSQLSLTTAFPKGEVRFFGTLPGILKFPTSPPDSI